MTTLDSGGLSLAAISLIAAIVNGGLGYGFSSITVPVALLYYSNKRLNPAMVLVEVVVNSYTLFVSRKEAVLIWRRILPILFGLLPGVALGSYVLFMVEPQWLRFYTYLILLPLILLQAGGVRRPIRAEKLAGLPFGGAVGFLYSVTTISGPPLAVMLNNQGFAKQEFRAALGLIRIVESGFTAIVYYSLGLYDTQSIGLLRFLVPSVLIGIPIGARLIRSMDPESFRRICMSFDAWVVGFGLSKVLISLHLAEDLAAYGVLIAVAVIDAALLWMFFSKRRQRRRAESPPRPATARCA